MMRDTRKELVLRSFTLFEEPALVDELVHPYWVDHAAPPGRRYGREAARATAREVAEAFADLEFEPTHLMADGDLVSVHVTMRGRQIAHYGGRPPGEDGEGFAVRQAHVFRIREDRLAEHWVIAGPVRPAPAPATTGAER